MLGLTIEEATPPPFEVLPDNWEACTLFAAVGTQWRMGPAGATGLDYPAVQAALTLRRVPRARWPAVFDDVRVMEDEALQMFEERRQQAQGSAGRHG